MSLDGDGGRCLGTLYVMKLLRLLLPLSIAVAVALAFKRVRGVTAAASRRRATFGPLDAKRLAALFASVDDAIATTSSAFDLDESGEPSKTLDAAAAVAVERLEAAIAECRTELNSASVERFDSVSKSLEAARAHSMALTFNRQTHGSDVDRDRKAGLQAKEAFEAEIRPLRDAFN